MHQRKAPGLNHLGSRWIPDQVDRLSAEGCHHGWSPLFAEKYPHAGGPVASGGGLTHLIFVLGEREQGWEEQNHNGSPCAVDRQISCLPPFDGGERAPAAQESEREPCRPG